MLRRVRAGVFDDGETFDLSWMDLPEGHPRISSARHALVGDSKVGAAAVPRASWTVMPSEGADRGGATTCDQSVSDAVGASVWTALIAASI